MASIQRATGVSAFTFAHVEPSPFARFGRLRHGRQRLRQRLAIERPASCPRPWHDSRQRLR
jgi:hypothetical protein